VLHELQDLLDRQPTLNLLQMARAKWLWGFVLDR
jgi:hypothetical protein